MYCILKTEARSEPVPTKAGHMVKTQRISITKQDLREQIALTLSKVIDTSKYSVSYIAMILADDIEYASTTEAKRVRNEGRS